MSIALRLAEFTRSMESTHVAPEVVARATDHILDTLGCIAFSTQLNYAQNIVDAVAIDVGPFGIPGVPPRLTLGDATFAAGTLAAGFELDDVGVFVHPGACIVPTAFLAAEHRARVTGGKTTGADLVAAVIIGYEVAVRISSWVGFGPEDEVGWHTPAFHGGIGAAATAARLWDLDLDQTMHALACAADVTGGGLMQARFGSDIKRAHTGRAAQTGIYAALLAQRGIRGRPDVFEDPRWGYFRTIRYRGGVETEEDLRGDPVVAGLGERFTSFDRIALKYYPCTAGAQGIHDNVIAALAALDGGADDVDSIRIEVSSWFYDQPETLRPATGIESANFSYAYAAALAAVHRAPRLTEEGAGIQVFLDGLRDARVRALQERIEFAPSQVLDAENRYSMDTIVEVKLRDGRSEVRRTGYGVRSGLDSDGTITLAGVDAVGVARKFRTLTTGVLPDVTIEAAIERIAGLQSVDDALPVWRSLQHLKETKHG